MIVQVDTREKKHSHVLEYLDGRNILWIAKKLDYGDYMNLDNPTVVVDRKRNLDEIRNNLLSSDKSRFWNEVRGAYKSNIKLIFLIEHGGKIKNIQDVAGWKSKYSKASGRALMNEMIRCHIAYGVEFVFCDKRSTGRIITELIDDKRGD